MHVPRRRFGWDARIATAVTSSATSKAAAHVAPKYPKRWLSSANPERTYTLLNDEHPEFVRFINPGDLRAAPQDLRVERLPRRGRLQG